MLLGVPTVTATEHNNSAQPSEAEEGCAPDPAFHLVAQRCSCCVPKNIHTSFVMAKAGNGPADGQWMHYGAQLCQRVGDSPKCL